PLEVYDIETGSTKNLDSIKETGEYLGVSVESIRFYLDNLENDDNLIFRGRYKIIPKSLLRKTLPEGSLIEVKKRVRPSLTRSIKLKVVNLQSREETIYESIKEASK
ncbi:hypothetical protein F8C76_18440, partial [Flagellimonas olearia]